MKLISTKYEYEQVVLAADAVVHRKRRYPDNVFSKGLTYYSFIPFDDLVSASYSFENLKNYLRKIGEDKFFLLPIEPDPASYYFKHFAIFNAWVFSVFDDCESYVAALRDYPEGNKPDALMFNGNVLLLFSAKKRWAIYGERGADVAVCAFSSLMDMAAFRSSYDFEYLADNEWAAEFAYRNAEDSENLMKRFRNSYSPVRR